MVLVKCRSCGTKIERTDAFKVVVDGKNLYYCNEGEYQTLIKKREEKDRTYMCINEIFGYKVTNTALFKEVNGLVETFSYEVIFAYLQENKDYLMSTMTRNFSSEYAKIRYFSAILKNSLADFKVKVPEITPKIVDVEMTNMHFSRKKKRRSIQEIEEESDEL